MPAHQLESGGNASPSSVRTYCKPCKKYFYSYKTYLGHLFESSIHFACQICHVDFHSPEALDRHMKQNHAHDQEITCWGCHKKFNRAGGFVAHIEYKQCMYINSGYIEELRANNSHGTERPKGMKAASGSAWERSDTACTWEFNITKTPSKPSGTGEVGPKQAFNAQAAAASVDLLTLDPSAPSRVLNADWDTLIVDDVNYPSLPPPLVPTRGTGAFAQNGANRLSNIDDGRAHGMNDQGQVDKCKKNTQSNISTTPRISATKDSIAVTDTTLGNPVAVTNSSVANQSFNAAVSLGSNPAGSVWKTSKTSIGAELFPNAPPAGTLPTSLLQSLKLSSTDHEPVYAEHDPHNPNWNASRYYDEFAEGYRCPHKRCKKTFSSVSGFVQHLKSPTHMDLMKVHCPHCLRPFISSAALTQHFESQAMRCSARKLRSADVLFEEITQIITKDGEFEDETNRYVIKTSSTSTREAASAIAQRDEKWHRRAVEDKAEFNKEGAKNNFQAMNW